MKIINAINRIKFRVNNKHWKANETDKQAINTIIEFVNQKHKNQINANELLAKLYIHHYSYLNRKYRSNIYDELPIKELHKLLEMPLAVHIQKFTDELNSLEVENLFIKNGISTKEHPATKAKCQKEKETDKLMQSIIREENKDALFLNTWDVSLVKDLLISQINSFLNTYYDARHRENKN
ncbi:hypothetical protein KFZ70_00630 [Tamlana fucoidanivorans]|uniref:Uncharacterized protein n=1 Tax=Allotamlana fucoidanivorans TaxID=2583814 RepID=A0A5C4SKT1_9FLAO|nr:hypothetical protein [Tamlana fucoidanivorans]TNJ44520.1 hypothetical protein FGF67_07695 [Tamlana fucoidanivorans]